MPSRLQLSPPLQVRKYLAADALYALVREGCERIPDHRGANSPISLADALMSGLALFSLKDPSLLAFDARRNDQNMKRLFGIGQVPSDTRLREILDGLDPLELRSLFRDVFRQLQRGKVLEHYVFQENSYLLLVDGTEYFSSPTIHCPACLEKKEKKTGAVSYSHQLLGAVLAHPDHREVFPLCPEPIVKQDGTTKNDCERNASQRFLEHVRREHPHLNLIVVEDGLASNGPHIDTLRRLNMHFILGVKPGDHEFLFQHVQTAFEREQVTVFSWQDAKEPGVTFEIAFLHDVPLNASRQDLRMNFLQYAEYGSDGHRRKFFTWVTDLPITRDNARHLVRGGRCRWKIENETFNTLKNQGYQFEHNFGHGEQHLSEVLALLMMLAFLIDQVQQHCCPLFRAVWEKFGTKRALWDRMRCHFVILVFSSWKQLYEVMLHDLGKEIPLPTLNTS